MTALNSEDSTKCSFCIRAYVLQLLLAMYHLLLEGSTKNESANGNCLYISNLAFSSLRKRAAHSCFSVWNEDNSWLTLFSVFSLDRHLIHISSDASVMGHSCHICTANSSTYFSSLFLAQRLIWFIACTSEIKPEYQRESCVLRKRVRRISLASG